MVVNDTLPNLLIDPDRELDERGRKQGERTSCLISLLI